MRLARQQIAQSACNDTGSRRDLKDARRSRRSNPPSDIVGEFSKEYRAKPVILKGRNAAGEVDGSVAHDASFYRSLNQTRLLQQPKQADNRRKS
jgi:hypothetical protein